MVERRAGRYREEVRRCSGKTGWHRRGEEILALHGRGAFKVTMNVFGDLIFALAIFCAVYSMTAHGCLHLPIRF